MNKTLKWGLIALLIYIIITPLGIFLERSAHNIMIDADAIEIPAQIMAGTFFFLSSIFRANNFNTLQIGHIFAFLFGGLIWFGVGSLFGWLLRKKEGKKENLNDLGKILMIGAFAIFIVLALIFFLMFLASGETDPLGIVLLFLLLLGIFAPPFVIGLILWIISKFLK